MSKYNASCWWNKEDHDTSLHAHAIQSITRDSRRKQLRGLRDIFRGWGTYGESQHKITKNAVTAIYAKLARSQPATMVTTDGAAIGDQERATFTTAWLAGMRVDLETDTVAREALHDAIIYGTGAVHTHEDKHGIHQEIVWIGDLAVERREEVNRAVRTLYRMCAIDREVAKSRWASKVDVIQSATFGLDEVERSHLDGTDLITVVEAWHIGEYGLAGRHAIVTSVGPILWEKWEEKRWPVDLLVWDRDPMRHFGVGLVISMSKPQEVIDYMAEKIKECFGKGSPKVFSDSNNGVAEEQYTDRPYEFIQIAPGTNPPTVSTPPAISSDWRVGLDSYVERAYHTHGVSQLAAMAMKPAGLDSGKALRAYNETEDAFWYVQMDGFEKFNVDLDRALIRCAETFVSRKDSDKDKLVTLGIDVSLGSAALRKLGYEEARFDRSSMRLKALPVARLSRSVSGLLSDIKEYMALEILEDKGEIRRLIGLPDLNRHEDLATAGRRLVQLQVAAALSGQQIELDPTVIDLEYAAKHAQQQLQLMILQESDGDEDGLRAYISQVASESERIAQKAAEAAQPPPQPAPTPPLPMGPGAPPGPAIAPPGLAVPGPMPPQVA